MSNDIVDRLASAHAFCQAQKGRPYVLNDDGKILAEAKTTIEGLRAIIDAMTRDMMAISALKKDE